MAGVGGSHPAQTATASLALSPQEFRSLVERAIKEDLGSGDLTTQLTVPGDKRARGAFVSQQDIVVAGLAVAAEVFHILDPQTRWQPTVEDGAQAGAGKELASVTGTAATLLAGERVALNFLQRLCGIASFTRHLNAKLQGLPAELLDTRKTTPGLRMLEKYAVRVGGGRNHRLRLDDGILIKNNHLRLGSGIRPAVESARRGRPPGMTVEVEVRNSGELDEALASGAEAILLDNMTPAQVRECVIRVAGRARLEVSGGVNAANIREYAETGVDYISVGALTHSAPAADIHFLVEPL